MADYDSYKQGGVASQGDGTPLRLQLFNNFVDKLETDVTALQAADNYLKSISTPIKLRDVWLSDMSALLGSAGTNNLGYTAGTHGTNTPLITTSDAGAATIAETGRFQIPIDEDITALQIKVSAQTSVVASDTSGETHYATLDLEAFASDKEGGVSADLVTTDAQDINSATWTTYTFTVTATSLSKGDVLDVLLTVAILDVDDTGVLKASIGSIEVVKTLKTAS